MNTAITLNSILLAFGTIVAIVAGITAIIAVVKWITTIHDRCQRWDAYAVDIDRLRTEMKDHQTDIEAKLQEIRSEQYILTSSMLAVLDGLQQLKCNGEVTKAHTELQAHLNKEAHQVR